MARVLAKSGVNLLLAGRSIKKLQTLAARLEEYDVCPPVRIYEVDLSDVNSREHLFARVTRETHSLHGIVNNAYSGRAGGLGLINSTDFSDACALNLEAPCHLVQLFSDLMAASAGHVAGGAAVVNVASMYGIVSPDPRVYDDEFGQNPVHYGATKAGLIQMTRYLACHLAKRGIRVNSISPGACPSDEVCRERPAFVHRLETKVPLARIGKADEIALPVLFLLSPASSYMTGADLRVDGGWTAW